MIKFEAYLDKVVKLIEEAPRCLGLAATILPVMSIEVPNTQILKKLFLVFGDFGIRSWKWIRHNLFYQILFPPNHSDGKHISFPYTCLQCFPEQDLI